MRLSRVRASQVLLAFALLGLLCLAVPMVVAHADDGSQPGQCSGYYYTVKRGDTWSIIARRVGAPVSVVKSANPQAVRPRDVIYAGEKLCIPSQGGGVEQGGYWYQVKPGDTWNKVASATGVSVRQLWEANRSLVNRRLWLYIGQRIWIPESPSGLAAPVETATPLPTMPPTGVSPAQSLAQPTETPTAVPTSTPTEVLPEPTAGVPTSSPTPVAPTLAAPAVVAEATPTPTAVVQAPANRVGPVTMTPTSAPTLPPIPSACPKTAAGYPDAVAAFLNKAGNTPEKLQAWLVACRVVVAPGEAVTAVMVTGPTSKDTVPGVVVITHDASADPATPKGQLLVYHKGSKGYGLVYKAAGLGHVQLIRAADVNADGKFDLVYSDRSCGAHTCFGTLHVQSWDGKTYVDWITNNPTIASPDYTIKDVTPDGQGDEILVHGGVIGSVGAGPQRAWTETYISPKGAPYVLLSQVYDPSTCLYHKILDANRAFDAWALDGFDPAIEAYKAALADRSATACGTIKDELATLRDFARVRLIVAYVAAGRATEGLALPGQITNPALKGAATAFLNSYKDNSSVIQACRDTTKYAVANPGSWQFLADWGYANPSFTAADLCPLS
jgi:LysM repeat protein